MRNVIYAALLVAAPASVGAQPVTQPKACQVTIARAPDDVRAVVETWVRSEPQCSVALEIRIVRTDGGLYLLAQDERGRIRERIVPDAQTAGVLVASWIADDNAPAPAVAPPATVPPTAAPPAAMPVMPPGPAPMAAPPIAPVSAPPAAVSAPPGESLSPPGLVPVSVAASAPARRSKWLAATAMAPLGEGSGAGLRLDADLIRRGKWLFGAAVSGSNSQMDLMSSSGLGSMTVDDYKAVAYVARVSSFGRWELRPSVGVGVVYTTGRAWDPYMNYSLSGAFPTVEASLGVSRELGASWAIYGGPLATVVDQQFEVFAPSDLYPRTLSRGNLDLVLLLGVRHRL
jgi:hypothetical protein